MMQLGLERYVVVKNVHCSRAQFVKFCTFCTWVTPCEASSETLVVASVLINFRGGLSGIKRVLVVCAACFLAMRGIVQLLITIIINNLQNAGYIGGGGGARSLVGETSLIFRSN